MMMNLKQSRIIYFYFICLLIVSLSQEKNLNHIKRDLSYEIDDTQQQQAEYKYYVQEENNNNNSQLPRDLHQKYASADEYMSFTVQPGSSAAGSTNQLENVTVKVGQQAVMPCFVNNLGSFKVFIYFH